VFYDFSWAIVSLLELLLETKRALKFRHILAPKINEIIYCFNTTFLWFPGKNNNKNLYYFTCIWVEEKALLRRKRRGARKR